MQKTQTKNCKNYFFHSSKTRVISSQLIYNARNAKTTSDSSFFMKVWACDNHIKKPAKFRTDLNNIKVTCEKPANIATENSSAGVRPGQVVQFHHSILRNVLLHHSILWIIFTVIQLFQHFEVCMIQILKICTTHFKLTAPALSLYIKGLQNCSSSKFAHTLRCPGIQPGPCRPYRFCRPRLDSRTTQICANFEELQFWSPLRYRDAP